MLLRRLFPRARSPSPFPFFLQDLSYSLSPYLSSLPRRKSSLNTPAFIYRSSLARARSVSETKEKGRASALCSRCHLHRRSAALAAPRYRRATEVPMSNTDDDDDENENENEDEDGQ